MKYWRNCLNYFLIELLESEGSSKIELIIGGVITTRLFHRGVEVCLMEIVDD